MNAVLLALIALTMIGVMTLQIMTLMFIRAMYGMTQDMEDAAATLYTKITGQPYERLERKHES